MRRGGAGGGFGVGSFFLSTLAASFIGTAIAQSFFDNDQGGYADDQAADGGDSDAGGGDTADAGFDQGDGGDFGGGDFGGF